MDNKIHFTQDGDMIPEGAVQDIFPQQADAAGTDNGKLNIDTGSIEGFPVFTLVLSFLEIIFTILLNTRNETVWRYDLNGEALFFAVLVIVFNAAAWYLIMKHRIYDAEKFVHSWDFVLSVIVPFLLMIVIFGTRPTEMYDDLWGFRLFGYDPAYLLWWLSEMLNMYGIFPFAFDFHWYMYILLFGMTLFFTWDRKGSIKKTIALTLIHPMFLMMIFRGLFHIVYEVLGFCSFL